MLRARLEQISNLATIDAHAEQVSALAEELPHTIVALESPHEMATYTCLVHALGFTDTPMYLAIADLPPREVFAGADFAHWLVDSKALEEVSAGDAANGDLVFYFNAEGRFKHVGLLRAHKRVESKWGNQGLYEHSIFEVPQSYGNDVRFFRRPSYYDAIDHFYDFAQENGIEFEHITPCK